MKAPNKRRLAPETIATIRALAPGQQIVIPLPVPAFSRRETVRAINATGQRLFGAGQYRMTSRDLPHCVFWREPR